VFSDGMLRPLLDTHPEFVIIERPSNTREFRVENKHLSPHAHRSWLKPAFIFPILVAVCWPWLKARSFLASTVILVLVISAYNECTQVLWESVIVSRTTDIQLETHRGIFGRPLFVSRRVIPLSTLSDVIINEGLRRWDVRYYLAVLTTDSNGVQIQVAYENLLPRFPVLHKIYLDIHEMLFNEKIN